MRAKHLLLLVSRRSWIGLLVLIVVFVVQFQRSDRDTGPRSTSSPPSAQTFGQRDASPLPAPGHARPDVSRAGKAPAASLTVESEQWYRSTEGLRYGPGSRHGHRLTHLMTHLADDPNRPGPHGVFEVADQGELVRLLDRAYRQAREGTKTEVKRDRQRTIYTVDMGRPIGYVGGQTGQRLGKPAARRIRLVLEDDRVITAFPVQ